MFRTVLKWFAGFIVLVVVVVFVLRTFFGLSLELDGSGIRPMTTFKQSSEEHMKAIEQKSLQDRKSAQEQTQAEAQPPAAAASQAPVSPSAAPKPSSAPWPLFYGPKQDGVYSGTILTDWPSNGLRQLWRRPVGGGYASLTVAQDLAFTIEQRRDQETVAAYELATGRERWTNSWKAFFQEALGGDGPRATPSYSDGRLYALGAAGEFRCLDASSGRVLWRKNILEEAGASNLQWGMAASPLIVDSLVVVMPGKGVTAYDKVTGVKKWSSLDDIAAYVAPMVATLAGVRQIVAVSGSAVYGLTIDEGKPLWEFPWHTENNINSTLPLIVDANRFIISSGYGHGASMVEVSSSGGTFAAKELWHNNNLKSKFNNLVLHQGIVYGLDEGIMVAIEAASGKRLWKGGRYGYGQILLAGSHIIVSTETGDVALVKASPDRHQQLSKFEALSGKTWNVPAIAEGILIVRNTTEMAAYRVDR